jgi:cytochrome subunit of sulfide dehydrogenase
MYYKKLKYTLFFTVWLFTLPINALESQSPQVSMLVNTCIACHGINGSSIGPATPIIAGMRKPLFLKAMRDMKSGQRPSTVMGLIAKGYTDHEFQLMADFFSQQKIIRYPQAFDPEKAKKGRQLHNLYCNGCHKIEGPTELLSNNLAGQKMPYVRQRLLEFINDEDPTTPVMTSSLKHFIENNSESDFDALIHYFGSHQ